jgi:N-acetylmuramoyl-L-alanine amidase
MYGKVGEAVACIATAAYVVGLCGYIHHQAVAYAKGHEPETVSFEALCEDTAAVEHTEEAEETEDTEETVYTEEVEDTKETGYTEEWEDTDSLWLLAACVEAEAGNQGLLGKRLVADVILNRVDSPDFPDTIEGVITQPYHFTSYWNASISSVSVSDETLEAVLMELEERSYPGLLFFTAGAYSVYGTPWRQVGDHYFSTK